MQIPERSCPFRMSDIAKQIDALDTGLFSFLPAQTFDCDRRALLALHSAVADTCNPFSYLEIGSYHGGSLQALMRDPRCRNIVSIDPRPASAPDARGGPWFFEDNSTAHMCDLLREIPDVDMDKLKTVEASTEALSPADLPLRPDYCFIDGEHTHDAVVRDARFCAEAIGGAGVIAFHDYVLIGSAISAFLRENWPDVSFAVPFTAPSSDGGGVFALELGGRGLLQHPAVQRAIGSRWHSVLLRVTNRPRATALPFLVAWAVMPAIDAFVLRARHGFREYVKHQRS
jgi:hypothetical protein